MTFLLIVTVSSLLLAAIMSGIAWRIAAEERRRSDARIAALAAEIHAPAAPRTAAAQSWAGLGFGVRANAVVRSESARLKPFPVQRPAPRWDDDLPIRAAADHQSPAPELFAQRPARSRGPIVVGVGALFVVAALSALIVMDRGTPSARSLTAAARTNAAAPRTASSNPAAGAGQPASIPLELVALGHERDGDRLTVRGIIRNPLSAGPVEQLTAVVLAFDAGGGVVTSGRAIIESAALRPGGESTFAISVPGAAAVARYRVSFRSGDRAVAHVDRRELAKVSS